MQTKFRSLIQPIAQQRNNWLFYPTLLVLALLISWTYIPAFAQGTVTRTPWEMNRGAGAIPVSVETSAGTKTTLVNTGDPEAFAMLRISTVDGDNIARIPASDDDNWETPPVDADGNIFFDESSNIQCNKEVDFTYFQTLVIIPADITLTEFSVTFSHVDDNARVYLFNSDYQDGEFLQDGISGSNVKTTDLSSLAKVGETNRVVIVQVDTCRVKNTIRNIQIEINVDGETAPTVVPVATTTTSVAAPAKTNAITVCSHMGTDNWNILGDNARSLRAKLTNPANFGPSGTYGDYQFSFLDVGNNFTEQKIVDDGCDIWFSGYEPDDSYTDSELAELQNWVNNHNGQVIAGCDASTHDPVCSLLGYSVQPDTDTYGFISDIADNPINCNAAFAEGDQLNMSGGAGAYFAGVDSQYVLAFHETDGLPDNTKPIAVYTGNYFLTSDINMIQTGSADDEALSDGSDVINNNDILAMNALSALADASIGVEVCSSVKKIGTLKVYSVPAATDTDEPDQLSHTVNLLGDTTVELILDASGSMTADLIDREGNSSTRIAVAKDVLDDVVSKVLPENIPVAMRVLGESGCNTRLATEIGPLDRAFLSATIADIQATDGATPLAASITAVGEDLQGVAGPKLVVLVTDGEETCAQNASGEDDQNAPIVAAQELRVSDTSLDFFRLNVIGYGIDDPATKERFAQLAQAGGGDYFDATDSIALDEAIKKALSIPFTVTNAQGTEVARGIIDGDPVELPEGEYTVTIQLNQPFVLKVPIVGERVMEIGLIR